MATQTTTPISVTYGQYTINQAVVPYIRELAIVLKAFNLKPYSVVNTWVDDVNVNQFVQPSSVITVNTGFSANSFAQKEGLYCNTTHAYAQVIENSSGGILYVDENFLCLNLTPYGPLNSNNFSATTFNPGDVVFQSNNSANVYANTFLGWVQNWVSQDGALAIVPIYGNISNTSTNIILFKAGSTVLSNVVNIVQGNKFGVGNTVTSSLNVANTFTVNSWTHYNGVISQNVAYGATNTINIAGSIDPSFVNSSIYITNGTGIGTISKIVSLSGNSTITLNNTITGLQSNSNYGIGNVTVDGIGLAAAILRIPSDPNMKFQTGNRLITMNDGKSSTDNSATMIATATLSVAGSISSPTGSVVTPVVQPTPIVSPASNTTVAPSSTTSKALNNNNQTNIPAASADPLVQTFFTPKPITNKTDNGIFASSVNIFFQGKPNPANGDTLFPVSVYIVSTDNGYPTSTVLGSATVRWENINTTDGVTTFPDSSNVATWTNFKFTDPVYLAPGTEYGIVVYSESPEYDIWICDLGETLINTSRLASQSPFVGSFFKAQNASTWSPIQNQQLMFVLNKAQFTTTPTSLLFNVKTPIQNTVVDQLLLHSSDLTFNPANISYGIQTTIANTLTQDSGFFSVDINTPFNFGSDLNNSSISSNRRRILSSGNANSMFVQVSMATTDPDVSPFFHAERFSTLAIGNMINAGGVKSGDITITSGGNHLNAANIVVTFSAPTGDGGVQATANVLALNGNTVNTINIINPGAGYVISPTITISEPSAPANATAIYNGEDQQNGGNGLTRYITRQINLADGFDSGDIQVFINAVRPQGTDINVYYKVLSGQDPDSLSNKKWKIMSKVADIFSPDQKTIIGLTFNTGTNTLGVPKGSVSYVENGVTYPIGGKFKSFAIKVVLTANDPTVPPILQNFRSIAVPAG